MVQHKIIAGRICFRDPGGSVHIDLTDDGGLYTGRRKSTGTYKTIHISKTAFRSAILRHDTVNRITCFQYFVKLEKLVLYIRRSG